MDDKEATRLRTWYTRYPIREVLSFELGRQELEDSIALAKRARVNRRAALWFLKCRLPPYWPTGCHYDEAARLLQALRIPRMIQPFVWDLMLLASREEPTDPRIRKGYRPPYRAAVEGDLTPS